MNTGIRSSTATNNQKLSLAKSRIIFGEQIKKKGSLSDQKDVLWSVSWLYVGGGGIPARQAPGLPKINHSFIQCLVNNFNFALRVFKLTISLQLDRHLSETRLPTAELSQ